LVQWIAVEPARYVSVARKPDASRGDPLSTNPLRRVLLIGDSARFARGLAATPGLQDLSFERTAGAADTLRRVRALPCDLVVTDRSTPIPEDLALAEELRLLRPGVPVVVVAPDATPRDVIEAMRARVMACFVEPVDEHELADMVRRALKEPDWQRGIEVLSARPGWISVRANCRLLTAERLVAFFSSVAASLPVEWRDDALFAFREVLLNAMEHGGGFDPDKAVEVSAIRTKRTLVYYVRDPGRGFRPDALTHAARPDDPAAHIADRATEGVRPGGFGLLLVSQIVDEVLFSEAGNEVLLIKHLA
jgi:anti-sigma regulatory factor (Ser/Thr protein kinase)/CheY-like chemotaxis protein